MQLTRRQRRSEPERHSEQTVSVRDRNDWLPRSWRRTRQSLEWWRLLRAMRRRPALYELVTALITALVIINATASGIELGNQAYAAYVKAQLADDIEAMIPVWEESIAARAQAHRVYEGQGITPYRATLERELLKQFAPQARALAARIRDARDDDLARYGLGEVLEQVTAGFGGQYAGGALGKEAGQAIGRLLEWEWNAAAIAEDSADLEVKWEAKRDLLRQLMSRLAATELDSWDKAEPLLRARAYRSIRYLALNRDQWSDEAYQQQVRERALSLAREFGLTGPQSPDSPFANFEELMGWLASQAGRALPGEQLAPEPPVATQTVKPTPLSTKKPIGQSLDAQTEYWRILGACATTEYACQEAVCARNDSDMCHHDCAECDSETLDALFDEDVWAQDDAVGVCSLAAAETYLAAVQAAQEGTATGKLKPSQGFRAETLARYAAQEANEKCIASACKTVCAMQGKDYALVYGMCKCK